MSSASDQNVDIRTLLNTASRNSLPEMRIQTVTSARPQIRYSWPALVFPDYAALQHNPRGRKFVRTPAKPRSGSPTSERRGRLLMREPAIMRTEKSKHNKDGLAITPPITPTDRWNLALNDNGELVSTPPQHSHVRWATEREEHNTAAHNKVTSRTASPCPRPSPAALEFHDSGVHLPTPPPPPAAAPPTPRHIRFAPAPQEHHTTASRTARSRAPSPSPPQTHRADADADAATEVDAISDDGTQLRRFTPPHAYLARWPSAGKETSRLQRLRRRRGFSASWLARLQTKGWRGADSRLGRGGNGATRIVRD